MSRRAEVLHQSRWRGVFYVTGGGTLLLSELLTTAGASATVLEARVPYAAPSMEEILGRSPEQACSDATARAMAMAAFQRARRLGAGSDDDQAFGLACTASLATTRQKRGQHRAHVAIQTASATYGAHVTFDADRETEELQLLELLWHALGTALELDLVGEPHVPPLVAHTPAQRHWRALVLGEELAYATADHDGRLLMPGAFNPLHHAHQRMLEIAEQKTALPGAFELSILNVDKPFLDYTEIDSRLRQFHKPVWVTRLPTFIEKARYFRGTHFVVGIDTLIRIVDPGYYGSLEARDRALAELAELKTRYFRGTHFVVGIDTLIRIVDPGYYGSLEARDRALAELAELKTRFVVFGRTLENQFLCLSDLPLPSLFRNLCIEISKSEFDEPVSSTELRRRR